jgi:hypothetical protein
VCWSTSLYAAPQEPTGADSSLTRIKHRLDTPSAPRLAPKGPVQLRPTFRSRTTERPWVPTLQEHLRDTFELTDFQRQYAKYASQCCGINLGAVVGAIDRALDERRERKVREQVASELAFVEAARAKDGR